MLDNRPGSNKPRPPMQVVGPWYNNPRPGPGNLGTAGSAKIVPKPAAPKPVARATLTAPKAAAPVQNIAPAKAAPAGANLSTPTGWMNFGKMAGGAKVSVPTKWLGQVAAQETSAAPQFSEYRNSVQPYKFSDLTPMNQNVGMTNASTAGLTQAALAQVDLIKAWGAENMAAAGESEVARGMGRSGAFDAALATEMDKSRMEAALQIGNAAAESSRLQTDVNQSNAANQLSREQANQRMYLDADQMRSGYNTDLANGARADWLANTENRLAYASLDEQARQYNQGLAQTQTEANRSYQGQQQNFNEGMRQFNNTMSFNKTANDRTYQGDRLAFSENQRQFGAKMAFDQMQSNRDYQMSRADLAEKVRQFDATFGQGAYEFQQSLAQSNSQFDRTMRYNTNKDQMDYTLAAQQAAAKGASGPTAADRNATTNKNRYMLDAYEKWRAATTTEKGQIDYPTFDSYLRAYQGY